MYNCYVNENNCISGKHAALINGVKDQCFLSQPKMTAPANNITTILQDANISSCLHLADRTSTSLRIVIPTFPYRLICSILIVGTNLYCSPLAGIMMSVIYGCEHGECFASVCIAGDLFVSDTHTGCSYRCHCIRGCHAIVIDVFNYLNPTDQMEICEIVFWTNGNQHFLALVFWNVLWLNYGTSWVTERHITIG